MEREEFYKEAGILTKDQLMGLVLSTESNGLDEKRVEQASQDWERYYNNANSETNFGWILCHLICKADMYNLYRLSKGFPEHVRLFVEEQILSLKDLEKASENE